MSEPIGRIFRRTGWLSLALLLLSAGTPRPDFLITRENGVVVVNLTQTPCQIVEAEVNHHDYHSTKAADCIAINKQTAAERSFKPLRLPPGKVTFRVTNKNVPYDLGFWVRGRGLSRVTLPTVAGGGLKRGQTKDYTVTLVKGQYWYSCPLNPTPNYPLIVK